MEMPFWAVKFSVSPARNPLLIVTVAPARLPPLSTSERVTALRRATGDPPAEYCGEPAIERDGAVWTVLSELVPVLLVLLLVLLSFTDQLIVRLVWLPPLVGSVPAATLYCTWSRAF